MNFWRWRRIKLFFKLKHYWLYEVKEIDRRYLEDTTVKYEIAQKIIDNVVEEADELL